MAVFNLKVGPSGYKVRPTRRGSVLLGIRFDLQDKRFDLQGMRLNLKRLYDNIRLRILTSCQLSVIIFRNGGIL